MEYQAEVLVREIIKSCQRKSRLIVMISIVACLTACHHGVDKKNSTSHDQIVVAKLKTPIKRLYFTGVLSPINTYAVISPVDGNIESMDFVYGERVTAGQKLFSISSRSLSDDYRKAVQNFLQKKESYETGRISFQGTQALYNAGVIAKDEYINDKTDFENKSLDYLQSQYALKKVLLLAGVNESKIEKLSLSDTVEVNRVLEMHFKNIVINATHDGIALFPSDNDDSSSHGGGKLEIGKPIKHDQLLLSIGDLSGLSAKFNVSEEVIDQIHKGMSVTVKGDAFSNQPIKGYVSAVSAQANKSDDNSAISMFSVMVKMPNISQDVMKKIRVGMTAKFELDIHLKPEIMLPVNAVTQQNGESIVTIIDAKGRHHVVPVTTGQTTPDEVVIVSGIQVGDKVLVP